MAAAPTGGDLGEALRRVLGAGRNHPPVRIEGLRRLSGGASAETWSFDAVWNDGRVDPLVLRRDVERPPGSTPRVREGPLLVAADAAGVPVPRVVVDGDATTAADAGLGDRAFLLLERVDGETIPRRILRDEAYAVARSRLTAQCGEALARIHHIPVDAVPFLHAEDPLPTWRGILDGFGQPHPTFELALRWLAEAPPPTGRLAVIHGDFRNGNLIVGPDGLRAVLDWELAHLGDPLEDLGWLCVKAWRFGRDEPVGGFGTREELFQAYEQAGGGRVDPAAARWWEVLGTLKWGIMCIAQAFTHLSGATRSVELAAIGRRVCENEWDLLDLMEGPSGTDVVPTAADDPVPAAPANPTPHDVPTVSQLVEAVRQFLKGDVMASTEGRVHFHTRVAVNVLAMVERELALGPAQARAHRAELASLGVADETELAARLRDGDASLRARRDDVVAALRRTVRAKLEVANPSYLELHSP